jgi:hypothetical protein
MITGTYASLLALLLITLSLRVIALRGMPALKGLLLATTMRIGFNEPYQVRVI